MNTLGIYELNQIYTGDCRELCKGIPDQSIDLIFTDPPYPKEYLYLYEWLAKEAARLLKPTGFMLVYAGIYWKNKIMRWMDDHLDYWWDYVAYGNGNAPMIWPRQTISRYKSIIAYRPKGGTGKAQTNVLSLYQGSDHDKHYHIWQQDDVTARYYIDCFSAGGAMVLDPFCGGGTTPFVCNLLKRNCVSFEVNPETAAIARQRLAQPMRPMLFVPELCQMDLLNVSDEVVGLGIEPSSTQSHDHRSEYVLADALSFVVDESAKHGGVKLGSSGHL